jgi:hypothetical protein
MVRPGTDADVARTITVPKQTRRSLHLQDFPNRSRIVADHQLFAEKSLDPIAQLRGSSRGIATSSQANQVVLRLHQVP